MLRLQEQLVTGRVQTILSIVAMLGKSCCHTKEFYRLAYLTPHPCGCFVVMVGHPCKVLSISLCALNTVECPS